VWPSTFLPGWPCLQPIPFGLAWARGSFPASQADVVQVEWHLEDDHFRLETRIPDHREGQIILPGAEGNRKVFLDGKPLSVDGKRVLDIESDETSIRIRVRAGTYCFEMDA